MKSETKRTRGQITNHKSEITKKSQIANLKTGAASLLCLALIAGCGDFRHPGGLAAPHQETRARAALLPHGGTDPVNGAAAEAMFFENHGVNPFVDADDERFSTFAVDVDTASYTVARRYLADGHLPPAEAVRVEEFVNAFDYGYAPPSAGAVSVRLEAGPSPFDARRTLLLVGLKARVVEPGLRKRAILTFVIDVSGSMGVENRLGLVKKSLRLLVSQLREGDRIGIVVYGSDARTVLRHTGAEEKGEILDAIDGLEPEGATNAEAGLLRGYALAEGAFVPGAINRIVLCSDGVANVGTTGPDAILERIREYVRKGITLSAVGFGMGNYNDVLMERLGDKGDGHYAYVDRLEEARRIFVENLTGTLQVVARDAKVQVEFDPAVVRSWRLVGYENRLLETEDFRDDGKDGGEVGSGHAVTALYEVKPWEGRDGSLGAVRVRYQDPDGGNPREIEASLDAEPAGPAAGPNTPAFRLATTVALFAEVLRNSYWAKGISLAAVGEIASGLPREFPGRRDVAELAELAARAAALAKEAPGREADEPGPGDEGAVGR
jgi:Ca-activated chloride channel family protein